MTKVKGESFENYKMRVKSTSDTRKVKMADLRHNTDIRRLKTDENGKLRPEDIERTIRYHNFYLELQELEKA